MCYLLDILNNYIYTHVNKTQDRYTQCSHRYQYIIATVSFTIQYDFQANYFSGLWTWVIKRNVIRECQLFRFVFPMFNANADD